MLGGLGVRQFIELNRVAAEVDRSQAITQAVDRLLSVMLDAETGHRGYLVTGDPSFLEPYRGADVRADQAMLTLAALLAADAHEHADLSTISTLVRAKFDHMARVIRLYDSGDRTAGPRGMLQAGKRSMDELRLVAMNLKESERAITEARAAQAERALLAARGFGISAILVALLLGGVAWSLSHSLDRRRQELANETIARLESARDAGDLGVEPGAERELSTARFSTARWTASSCSRPTAS